MRYFTILTVLALSATSAVAGSDPAGGSIQALLERLSGRHADPSPAPEVVARSEANNDTAQSHKKRGGKNLHAQDTARVERLRRKMTNDRDAKPAKKRWVWGTAIIQDGDTNAPPVGVNTNLLNTYAADTPKASLAAPSVFPVYQPPVMSHPTAAPDVQAYQATHTPLRKVPGPRIAVVPSSFGSATPAAKPSSSSATPVAKPSSAAKLIASQSASTKAAATAAAYAFNPNVHRGKPGSPVSPKARSVMNDDDADSETVGSEQDVFDLIAEEELLSDVASPTNSAEESSETDSADESQDNEKRWVWGTSIIQDNSPTSGLPPPGVNVNEFSTPPVTVSTPRASLAAPSFPPKPSASSLASSAKQNVVSSGTSSHAASSSVIERSTSSKSLKAASSTHTSSMTPRATSVGPSGIARVARSHHMRKELHQGHGKLAKKWSWGSSIIQDGDPAPTGAVADSSDTPQASLPVPTFAPVPAAVASSAPTPASDVPQAQILPVVATTTSSAPTSTATKNWFKNEWDEVVSDFVSIAHKMFGGSYSTTTSTSSPTPSAAQKGR